MDLLFRLLRYLLLFGLGYLLYIIGALVIGTLQDFQPEGTISLEPDQAASQKQIADSTLSFLTWNVGYGGLGEESDFFFDGGGMLVSGGRMVRPDQNTVEKNVAGAEQFIETTQTPFYLLQEVDRASKRSYFIDQYQRFMQKRPDYMATFSVNYLVNRVPLPIFEPWKVYGKVESGLATLSAYQATENTRYQLPGDYSWPTRIFQLDRCASLHRYPTAWGPELVVINAHLSAFDKGGVLKAQQMEFLHDLLLKEYEAGNYVVVGGDWNQCPPYFPADSFQPDSPDAYEAINIEPTFMPEGWVWAYDTQVPTNRSVKRPYQKGTSFTTLIDFFLVSPNVKLLNVRGINMDFQYADHQPVYMEVQLQ